MPARRCTGINNGNEIFIINLNRPCTWQLFLFAIYMYIRVRACVLRLSAGTGRCTVTGGGESTMLKRNAHKSIKLWSALAYKRTSPAPRLPRSAITFFSSTRFRLYLPSPPSSLRHNTVPYRRRVMYNKSSPFR